MTIATYAHDLSINDMGGHDGISEKVYVEFADTWRGEDVTITLVADRYTHSTGISEWRIYVDKAYTGSDRFSGKTLTDTAKSKLRAKHEDEMIKFLASDDYKGSETHAYYREIMSRVRDLKPYGDRPADRVRRLITLYAMKLGADNIRNLLAACDAYERFAKFLDVPPTVR